MNWGFEFIKWLQRDQQRRNEIALVKMMPPAPGTVPETPAHTPLDSEKSKEAVDVKQR